VIADDLVIALAKLANETCFDNSGQPIGKAWGRVMAPAIGDREVFAIEINGQEFEPAYRDGDLVIASRDSEIRRGDRVLIGCADDTVRIVRVGRQDSDGITVEPIVAGREVAILRNVEIRWIARIVWASQ
jgi:phage repressor protein C with HTH and peptisase S24 domain